MLESVRARLALWHAATLGVLLIAFAFVAYAYLERSTLRRTDEYLRASAGAFATELRGERAEEPTVAAAAHEALSTFRLGNLHVTVLDAALRPIATDTPAAAPGAEPEPGPVTAAALAGALRRNRHGPALFTVDDEEGGYRIYSMPVEQIGRAHV